MTRRSYQLEPINDHYNCCVCYEPMQEVFTLIPCLHKLCGACAPQCRACPTCRAQVDHVQKDHMFTQIVQEALEARRPKCIDCGELVDLESDTNTTHRCISELVARFTEPFVALSGSLKEILIAHRAKGLDMDDDTLTTMLLAEQELIRKARRLNGMRRFTGVVETWSKGKRGEMCGFVKPSDGSMSLFLHTRDVKYGTAAVGKVVSYRAEPSPKGEGYRNAYDVAVLQPDKGEVVGYVTKWQKDKNGKLYGFLKVKAAEGIKSAYFTQDDIPVGSIPPAAIQPGFEAVLTVVNSPGRPDGHMAQGLQFFSTRRAELGQRQSPVFQSLFH